MEQLNLRYTINSNGSITTSWDDISGAVRYHAYMYIKGKGTIYNETDLTTTSYTSRPDLDANEFYQVTVTAYGASSSLASDGARILIPSDFYNNVPLGIPQNIDIVAEATSVTISFDKVVRATGYDILLNGTVYSLTSSLSRVSKMISGLTPKTSYSFSVRAKNNSKTGEYSTVRTFTTPAVSPTAPTGITKSVTQNSVTIGWNPVNTATRYKIIFNGITYSVNTTSKTFTGLYPGTEYQFKIRGNNSDAQGIYTNEMTVVTAPQTPTGISAISTDTTITINWNAVPGAANYFVYFLNKDVEVKGTDTYTTFTNTRWRAYDNWEQSILDHNSYIATRSTDGGKSLRYGPLIGCGDPELVCWYLQRCGYATSITYAESLINDYIVKYDLTAYDGK